MNDDDFKRLFRREPERPGSAWEDVLREVSTLGDNLALAVRVTWERDMQRSVESLIDGVNRAIDGSTTSPEAQQAREQLARVSESVRQAAERTVEDVGPQLLTMLQQANSELRRLTGHDDRQDPPPPPQLY
ncbi:MAG: hypothetical protein JO023_18410 [Chloroflexi bacterium]|nr:hypothetical protein [Chloroflexota bacterium]